MHCTAYLASWWILLVCMFFGNSTARFYWENFHMEIRGNLRKLPPRFQGGINFRPMSSSPWMTAPTVCQANTSCAHRALLLRPIGVAAHWSRHIPEWWLQPQHCTMMPAHSRNELSAHSARSERRRRKYDTMNVYHNVSWPKQKATHESSEAYNGGPGLKRDSQQQPDSLAGNNLPWGGEPLPGCREPKRIEVWLGLCTEDNWGPFPLPVDTGS